MQNKNILAARTYAADAHRSGATRSTIASAIVRRHMVRAYNLTTAQAATILATATL